MKPVDFWKMQKSIAARHGPPEICPELYKRKEIHTFWRGQFPKESLEPARITKIMIFAFPVLFTKIPAELVEFCESLARLGYFWSTVLGTLLFPRIIDGFGGPVAFTKVNSAISAKLTKIYWNITFLHYFIQCSVFGFCVHWVVRASSTQPIFH